MSHHRALPDFGILETYFLFSEKQLDGDLDP
jgi:hypothetical protein